MVKKLLMVALLAAAGRFLVGKIKANQAEQELWAEATDPVPPAH